MKVTPAGAGTPPPAEDAPAKNRRRAKPEKAPKGQDAAPARKRGAAYKIKIFLFMAAILAGFLLFAVNAKGFIDSMRIDNIEYSEEGPGGGDGDIVDVPAANEDADAEGDGTQPGAQPEAGTDTGTKGAQPEAGADTEAKGAGADAGSLSAKEAMALKQEAQDAKNAAATMEQELNNAKALLDASTAREAQLKEELSKNKKEKGGG